MTHLSSILGWIEQSETQHSRLGFASTNEIK
jgi:hypothetical protein